MSFGVVGVAVDRLRTVYGLMRLERTGRAGMCCAYKDQLYFVKVLFSFYKKQLKHSKHFSAFNIPVLCWSRALLCAPVVCLDNGRLQQMESM
jgi:hypothetical protein